METIIFLLFIVTLAVFTAYVIIDLYNDMDYTLQSCRSLLNKYQMMENLNHIIKCEVNMRSSALKVINQLKKEYITDPGIIKQLDDYMKDADDILRMHDMVSGNMKHYAMMASDIIDSLAALKNGIPSFLMSKYFKEAVNNAINEANELWEKTYNYSNEYETDSNNQVPQLD